MDFQEHAASTKGSRKSVTFTRTFTFTCNLILRAPKIQDQEGGTYHTSPAPQTSDTTPRTREPILSDAFTFTNCLSLPAPCSFDATVTVTFEQSYRVHLPPPISLTLSTIIATTTTKWTGRAGP